MQRLSGIATLTRQMTDAISGTSCRLLDTRKTTPLWRALEKEAVRHGGGTNHRFGLYDGVLIKDNHIAAVGGVREAVRRARQHVAHVLKVEVEVENLQDLEVALEAGADVVLLDNFSLEDLKVAVALTAGRCLLEASGGVTSTGFAPLPKPEWITSAAAPDPSAAPSTSPLSSLSCLS